LLARREHSRAELEAKLLRRGYREAEVASALDALQDEGLLSHARYAEAFVRARVERGQGPLRIAFELRQRGVESELVEEALAAYADEWVPRAEKQVRRRFGAAPPEDFAERARRMRFLERRGFPAEATSASR
jgi:regulatory protein